MILYLLLGFILLFFSIFGKKSKILLLLLLGILVIVSSIRSYSVGADTLIYLNEYNYASTIDWGNIFSVDYPLFIVYCKFILIFWADFRAFIVITSIIIGLLLYLVCNKTDNPVLTLTMFYFLGLYLQTFCILRQSLSILFVAIGFIFLLKEGLKNTIIYYIFNVISIGFHIVSVIMLILPIVYFIFKRFSSSRNKYFIIGIIGFIVFYIISNELLSYIIPFFSDKYQYLYSETGRRSFDGNIYGGILYTILYLILYAIYYLEFDTLDDFQKRNIGILFILAFSFNAFSYISADLGRLNLYIEWLLVFNMSNILNIEYRNKNVFYFVNLLIFTAYLILYLNRDSIGVVPYTIFF